MANLTQLDLDTLLANWLPHDQAADAPDYVLVLDVGQGNLNAVMNAQGQPVLYFDMGRGVKGGAYTFPEPRPALCQAQAGKYILSHWDEDHIQYGIERVNAGALHNTEWLAPDQWTKKKAREYMSDKAKSFGKKLKQNGRQLFLWPDNYTVPFAQSPNQIYTVLKINGKDMNESGIALKLRHAVQPDQFMLLLGDACFEAGTVVHNLADGHCVALAAGHHGAQIKTEAEVPKPRPPPVAGRRTLAYSFGWGNQFGLPNGSGIASYEARDWQDGDRLDTGGGEAGAILAGPRGNLGMLWPGQCGPGRPSDAALAAAVLVGASQAEIDLLRDAAVALFAAGCAELTLYGHAAVPDVESVVAAVAYAVAQQRLPAVAALLLNDGDDASTLATCAAVSGPVTPASLLARSLGNARHYATEASTQDLVDLASGLSIAVLDGAAAVAQNLSNAANAAAAASHSFRINSLARTAALAARACADAAQTLADAETYATASAQFDHLWDYDQQWRDELDGALDRAQLATAIGTAIATGASLVIGDAGDDATRAQAPPLVAAGVVEELEAMVPQPPDYIQAAIGAVVGCMPAINIDPYAGDPGRPPAAVWACEMALAAAIAAMVAVDAGVAADVAASAAVAAVRVMMPAACGAPQAGCHRHPSQCGASTCHLSVHYLVPE